MSLFVAAVFNTKANKGYNLSVFSKPILLPAQYLLLSMMGKDSKRVVLARAQI